MELNRSDIRKLIYYGYARGLNAAEISKEINGALGENTVSVRICQNWTAKFAMGDYNIEEKPRSGRPKDEELDDKIEKLLDEDRHLSTRRISEMLGVSHITVGDHLKAMGKKYLCNKWVPHKLSTENKLTRVNICNSLLLKYEENNFLSQLVTCDETWVNWQNEGFGSLNRSWQGAGDTTTVPRRTSMTTKKHMVSVFWDCKGVLLFETLPQNETIDSEYYCNQLDRLKIAMQQKIRRLSGNGFHSIHFLQDNARSHVARISLQKIREIGFTIIDHPPYSPDIAPSDFYLFAPMKSCINGKNYDNVEDINKDLLQWLNGKDEQFYRDGI